MGKQCFRLHCRGLFPLFRHAFTAFFASEETGHGVGGKAHFSFRGRAEAEKVRIRGKNVVHARKTQPGKTPRVWGRPRCAICGRPADRNTPTRVGKTLQKKEMAMPQRKHPHACGEDETGASDALTREETPPRVWGRLFFHMLIQRQVRNTPTRVGKTGGASADPPSCRKHPHACGED